MAVVKVINFLNTKLSVDSKALFLQVDRIFVISTLAINAFFSASEIKRQIGFLMKNHREKAKNNYFIKTLCSSIVIKQVSKTC